ncbi:SusC/RagA family TonB-linked outer membrane protein, partial [Butyricimonas paravirosa]
MKWCIAFICLFTLNLSANVYSQKNIVSLDLSDVSVEQFVKAVKQQTSLKFMYNSSLIRQAGKISVKVENKELKDVLSMVLGKVNLEYEFFNNVILIRQKGEGKSEQQKKKVVNGTVKDEHGVTLPGVSVLIKGESVGVATDINGKYSITIPENKKEVVFAFSFVGMVPVEVRYTGQDSINVVLKEDVEKIDEVVVNGYFTRKKESYTGVSTTFSGNDLRKVSTGNILNTLSMLDPSFTKVVNNEMGSDPNTIPNFEIRGSSSLKADFDGNPNMPTFIMDGFEVSAEKVFDLDPTRVRFITILKDAAATAIYGSRAANGVVVIETEAPKPGKLQLSYNGSMNFEVADLSDYNLMNAEEKLEYEVRAGLYDKEDRPDWTDDTFDAYNQKLKLVKQGNDVDWLAIPVRELGVGHKHSIIAEGGNESFRYALDLSYSNKIGVMKGSKRDTYGGGIRLQYNLKKLKFTDYASFDHVKSVNSPYGNFSAYQYYNPYYNPYDENGNVKKMLYEYSYYDRGFQTKKMYNELYNAVLPSKDQSTSNRFLNNFAIEYDIIQGLKLKANLSLSVDNGRTDVYKPYENTEFIDKEKKGSYSQGQYEDFSYDVNIILTYFKTFKKHVLNAGFIYNLRETNHDQTDVYALGFPNANMDHISMGAGFKEGDKPGGAYDVTRLVGFVGNLGYTYDERFLLDFSVRSDG